MRVCVRARTHTQDNPTDVSRRLATSAVVRVRVRDVDDLNPVFAYANTYHAFINIHNISIVSVQLTCSVYNICRATRC